MPRHDPDRDDYREPPRRQSSNATVIVLIVVVAVLLVVVVACGALFFLGWRTADRLEEMADVRAEQAKAKAVIQPAGEKVGDSKRIYTRDEFRKLVMGKTPDEVIAAVGKPDHTQKGEPGTFWYYTERTRDPATGKMDRNARLAFQDGRVSAVTQ
jgi:outer membrane protein assembly factor BamE (lipoprotein component of BamABCDE complex)